jgi:hypothetical protein
MVATHDLVTNPQQQVSSSSQAQWLVRMTRW